MTWQFTLTGLLLGTVVGVTGMGGGSLMTPILVIAFGFKPTYAVGTDIFHGAIFKSFGAVRHRRLGTVHSHLALWLFAGSGPLAIAGVVTAVVMRNQISNAETILGYVIGVALIAGGAGFLVKPFVKGGIQASEGPFIMSRRDKLIALGTGAVFGFIVGLTSVGSGALSCRTAEGLSVVVAKVSLLFDKRDTARKGSRVPSGNYTVPCQKRATKPVMSYEL